LSDEVCGYCGRANGWHMVGCPGLVVGAEMCVHVEETDEDIVVIAKLPEVE
jgi:hypothetical protein